MIPIAPLFERLLNNQMIVGGLLLTAGGAASSLLRSAPRRGLAWLRERLVVSVEVRSQTPPFEWLVLWFHQHPSALKARNMVATSRPFRASAENPLTVSGSVDLPEFLLSPAPGTHLLRYRRQLVWVSREEKEETEGGRSTKRETFRLWSLGNKQRLLRELLADVRLHAGHALAADPGVYVALDGYWDRTRIVMSRPLETVVLPAGIGESLLCRVQEFQASRAWYHHAGVPYRMGILLHGLPGTGKTSVVGALAHHLNLNLYVLNLAANSTSDAGLSELLRDMNPGSILLIEDIDAVACSKKRKNDRSESTEGFLSTSGLLNAIDGILAPEGCILVLTTNHREKLDPALIRPGRVDYEVCFGHATDDQIRRTVQRFYPDLAGDQIEQFMQAASSRALTMAQWQQFLLLHKRDPTAALRGVARFLESNGVKPELKPVTAKPSIGGSGPLELVDPRQTTDTSKNPLRSMTVTRAALQGPSSHHLSAPFDAGRGLIIVKHEVRTPTGND